MKPRPRRVRDRSTATLSGLGREAVVATVIDGDFEWDADKASTNRRKYGVTFVEAATVFEDLHAIDAPDVDDDERFVIIGRSRAARLLFVVRCERGRRVRIISANVASRAQRRRYEEGP